MTLSTKRIAGFALVAALSATSLSPAVAAPFMANAAAIKSAAQGDVVDVYWRRGYGYGYGGAAAAGIIGGLALGAVVASQPYYGSPAYYGRPYYAPPAYYAPPPVYQYEYGYAAPVYPQPYYRGSRDIHTGNNW